jgi:hypothetical protein
VRWAKTWSLPRSRESSSGPRSEGCYVASGDLAQVQVSGVAGLFAGEEVAAGIDMSLGFVRDQLGSETARNVATAMEYRWTENAQEDHFAG